MSDSRVSQSDFVHDAAGLARLAASAALAWQERTGGRIVGFMGADVPVEMIEAAGLYPLLIGAGPVRPLQAAARFCERGDSDVVAQLAEMLLDGSLGFLDHVVVGQSPIFNLALFHFIRESRRLDPALPAPPLSLLDMHHGGGAAVEAFNRESCARLRKLLGDLGKPITDAALTEAIDRGNERRRDAAKLAARRRADPPQISGSRALRAIARGQMMPFEPLVMPSPAPCHGPRLLFSGTDMGHLAHYPLIEEAGCVIVADDHDWGEQVLENPVAIDSDPLAALVRRYTEQAPRAARWPSRTRIPAVVERAVAARVDGVVFWISDEDHASNWDLPLLTAALHERGIATLDLGPLPLLDFDAPAILERVAIWIDTLTTSRRVEARA